MCAYFYLILRSELKHILEPKLNFISIIVHMAVRRESLNLIQCRPALHPMPTSRCMSTFTAWNKAELYFQSTGVYERLIHRRKDATTSKIKFTKVMT